MSAAPAAGVSPSSVFVPLLDRDVERRGRLEARALLGDTRDRPGSRRVEEILEIRRRAVVAVRAAGLIQQHRVVEVKGHEASGRVRRRRFRVHRERCAQRARCGEELAAAIEATVFNSASCPVYQNVVAKAVSNPSEIKKNLIDQLTGAVRWTQSVQAMVADGATHFTECGPGKVLQGLVQKIFKEAVVDGVN